MTLSHPHSQVLYQKFFISKHCNYTNLGLSALWVKFLNLRVSLLSVFQLYSQSGLLLCFTETPRCFPEKTVEREPCSRMGDVAQESPKLPVQPQFWCHCNTTSMCQLWFYAFYVSPLSPWRVCISGVSLKKKKLGQFWIIQNPNQSRV